MNKCIVGGSETIKNRRGRVGFQPSFTQGHELYVVVSYEILKYGRFVKVFSDRGYGTNI